MEDDLKPTFYCDHGHPDLQTVAASLKAGGADPIIIARRTFNFVRNKIPFGFDLYQRRASATLKRGFGACWNKALLLVALLRCNQIPARFGSIPLKRSFIKPAIGLWHWLANNPYNHCLVNAYLHNRWVILDAVLDPKTYEVFFLPWGVDWGIDWHGEDDVRLYTESVVGPPVLHLDIDAALNNRVGNVALPKFLAIIGHNQVNRQMWKKAGTTAAATAVDDTAANKDSGTF